MVDLQKPVWLLDVDGVLNVDDPGRWGGTLAYGYATAAGRSVLLQWMPPLISRIHALHAFGLVEARWSTTWCAYADELERLWELPQLGRAFTEPLTGDAAASAKLATARSVRADGRRLIWSDDLETPTDGPVYEELTGGGHALLIRPDSWVGLQPDDLDAIETFAVRHTSAEAAG
ncbi:hypothetical protein ACI2K4_33355 [Micromonospora sp. NPDC050397]|uniref:hypothetical protein n=1 Tax=Micromonospora sp. NPDC050397 TaxID=3364279 RepID=UPI00385134A5